MEKQKKYGFINNFIYALNIERKSNLRLLAITLIKPVADIICTLLWSYAPKYVLSFIENNLPIDDLGREAEIIKRWLVASLILLERRVITVSNLNIERQKDIWKS